jgi:putative aldouronate transport system permease protein
MITKRTRQDVVIDTAIYIFMGILAISTLLPLFNVFAISFSNSAKAAAGFVTVYPIGFNVEAYKMVLHDKALITAATVSIERVGLSLVINMILTLLVSYPLCKDKRTFPLRNVYMWIVLGTMLFPPNIVPLFFTVKNLHMLGTIWSLVLPGAVSQFFIILMFNYFKGIPVELDESASIDGASPWRRLFQIYVPLSKPIIATIALFTLVFSWNAYFDGLIYAINTSDYPLQTYVQQLVVQIVPQSGGIMTKDQAEMMSKISNRTLNAAKIVITMVPIIVIYPFMQKYFISGIMLGSVKE